MVLGVGGGEQIVLDAQLLEQINKAVVVFFVDFLNGLTFLICRDRNRRTV